MSLDIALSPTSDWSNANHAGGLALEDDGCFWFLYPFFEVLWAETGQRIDLYGSAVFAGEDLLKLLAVLRSASRDVETRTEEWSVSIGERNGEPILDRVSSHELQELLGRISELAEEAIRSGQCLLFYGD